MNFIPDVEALRGVGHKTQPANWRRSSNACSRTMRVRHIDTPHVPHAWEARVMYEETTRTLLCGDLLTQFGDGPAVTEDDVVEPAGVAEDAFGFSSLAPSTPTTIEKLAELAPSTLAVMHGPSYTGDCAGALRALAGTTAAASPPPPTEPVLFQRSRGVPPWPPSRNPGCTTSP